MLTVNIYLPAIPALQASFMTTKAYMGMTISLYMLGLAIGIPTYGALSDHINPKKILGFGLAIYLLASILAIFSTNIHMFMIARLLQGLSAASALSLWQLFAFIFFEQKAKHIISSGFIIIGSMPALAPLVGGIIISYTSWHGIFIFLTILAVAMLALTAQLKLPPETLKKRDDHHQSHIILSVLKQYGHVFYNLEFLVLTIASSFVYLSVYMYISEVPFLLTKLHFSTKEFSLFFIPISVAFIIGGFLSKAFLKANISFIRIFLITNSIAVLALITVIVSSLIGIALSGWLLMTPFFIFTISAGIAMPNLVSEALHQHPLRRGTAASAIGLTQNLLAFIFTGIASHLTHYGYNGLIVTYFIVIGLPVICFFIYSLIKK
ncbi:MFS transporter [Francisella sp. 19X1-34]|uniref:MFS transporter n=1 Tax=Francisella sp. 19X1-34 TaxID=3087177 RepID=UPI002E319E3F|nr:MFS transporter [Francisella sp. 19X1-34]MED7789231.1 MFS transporter [Francisella sp. 19X1-34]